MMKQDGLSLFFIRYMRDNDLSEEDCCKQLKITNQTLDVFLNPYQLPRLVTTSKVLRLIPIKYKKEFIFYMEKRKKYINDKRGTNVSSDQFSYMQSFISDLMQKIDLLEKRVASLEISQHHHGKL